MDFCTSSDFERRFEAFARKHAPTFLAALTVQNGDEQPMEFHQAYMAYLEEFEALIEGFIKQVSFACVLDVLGGLAHSAALF
jgi:hypothetical protein